LAGSRSGGLRVAVCVDTALTIRLLSFCDTNQPNTAGAEEPDGRRYGPTSKRVSKVAESPAVIKYRTGTDWLDTPVAAIVFCYLFVIIIFKP